MNNVISNHLEMVPKIADTSSGPCPVNLIKALKDFHFLSNLLNIAVYNILYINRIISF